MEKGKTLVSGKAAAAKPKCGIVRPIADIEGYPNGHWAEVHDILCEAVSDAGYEARLVSENESVGVILGNVVSNLYGDPIVICDVSARNPNVMFELGMRIAFEKPTIIVTDDLTPFSFDISPIKHLIYPHSLRFKEINRFKEDVASAISATVEQSREPAYRGYLQQFGPIKIAELGGQVVSPEEILEDLRQIRQSMRALEAREVRRTLPTAPAQAPNSLFVRVGTLSEKQREAIVEDLSEISEVSSVNWLSGSGDSATYLKVRPEKGYTREEMRTAIAPVRRKHKI